MTSDPRPNLFLITFVLLSLLLHLVLLWVPRWDLFPQRRQEAPVFVEVRPPQVRPRELDTPPPAAPQPPREQPARRLGPEDRVAVRETAPRGRATEDRRPAVPQPAAPQPAAPPAVPTPPRAGDRPAPSGIDLNLPQATQDRLHGAASRQRSDVAEGEVIWLDTEKDLLASFFRRFRDGIYRVWNYPQPAAELGEQGVSLLQITILRDGSVENVELLSTSGYPRLDREAIAAVYRGATYGNLPRSFEGERLTFRAYFQYRLVYGGTRAGDITGR